jgi:DNA-damage-inducible protein J
MAVVEAILDDEIKRKAEEVLALRGMSSSTYIRLMFERLAEQPNAETAEAMEAARRGETVKVGDIEGLFASLHADD